MHGLLTTEDDINKQSFYLQCIFKGCNFDFECDHSKEGEVCGWIPDGEAFKNQPTFGDNPTARHRGQPSKLQGSHFIGGYENRQTPDDPAGAIQGDGPQGTLTSPIFRITGRYISFLIGGGCDHNVVRAELHVEEKKVSNRYMEYCFHVSGVYQPLNHDSGKCNDGATVCVPWQSFGD